MEQLSQDACKVANRVALSMEFADSSGLPNQIGEIIREGVAETSRLLDRLNPVELREWYAVFESVFAGTHVGLIEDPDIWMSFLGAQCDELHRIGLHQKKIASLGDELAVWDRMPVTFDEFADGLDHLASLVTEQQEVLVAAIDRQAGHESISQRRSQLFSNCVCGVALVLASIQKAIDCGNPREQECAALANFGARLTCNCVRLLFKACNQSNAT